MSISELDNGLDQDPPIWAIFGDLMTGLVGVFVLLLVWALGFQLELSQSLEKEIQKREVAEQRRQALEEALADPLAAGRVTLRDGKIGISGSVLFSLNSAELQEEGRELLHTLRAPLQVYRALDKLVERGLAHRLESLNAFVACADEHCHRKGLIAFAICEGCGKVDEFADAVIEDRLGKWAGATGFKVERTTMEIRGKCAECLKAA